MSEKNKPDVLFSVTEDSLETGLRGVPVGYCTTSFVDATTGLHYRGIPISDLYNKTVEEIIYLLFYGMLPSQEELALFSADLEKRSVLEVDFFERIEGFPFGGNPMKVFSSAILLAGSIYGTGDWTEDALNIVAKVPLIAGGVIRYTKGQNHASHWPVSDAAHQSAWIGRLASAMGPEVIPEEKRDSLIEILRLFVVLHMDHGGGNLSTFVGKAIASGLEDIYGSLAGAMLALEGPRHGRANQDCIDFLERLISQYGSSISEEQLEKAVQDIIAEGGLIYGYGHAVLRVEDVRASVLYEVAEKRYSSHPLVKMALLLRKAAPRVLARNPKIADPYPNVDAISGPVLMAAGFLYPDAIPVLFGCARIIGIARQILYERLEARDGKGTPIIRPKYLFVQENKPDESG